MTCTDRLLAGVIGALLPPAARLYEMKAALGVVSVCVALATTMEVMITTTAAKRMTNGRECFWIWILMAFILCGVCVVAVCVKTLQKGKFNPAV
jgi:VIT1/CCC1 family predicted Fe2+/Mn2+ transporter